MTEPLENIAIDRYRAGKFDEAEEDFRRALAILDAKNINVSQDKLGALRKNYGLVLAEKGDNSGAMDNLLFALKAQWYQLSGDLAAMTRIEKQIAIDELFPLANLKRLAASATPTRKAEASKDRECATRPPAVAHRRPPAPR